MIDNSAPNAPQYNNRDTELDDIDLRKLFGELVDNRFLIISCVTICAFIGIAYSFIATPIYKSSALVQVEDSSGGVLALDDIGDMFASNSSADTELYILKSRYVIGQTVDDLDLTTFIRNNYFPVIGKYLSRSNNKSEILADPLIGTEYAWGGEKLDISYLDVPSSLFAEEFVLVTEGNGKYSLWLHDVKLLSGELNIPANNPKYGVTIKVSELDANPGTKFFVSKKSRLVAIMELQNQFKASSLGKDTGIMQLSLLGSNRSKIASILDSIAANYVSQNVKRLAEEAENSLAFIEDQLPLVRLSLVESEKALNKYRETRDSVDLSLETESLLSGLVSIESEISAMTLDESEISRRFTIQHPAYQSFKRQQADLVLQRDQLNAKINSLPETQQKILTLMRDFEVNQAVYLSLQSKSQELSIVKASTVGNVRILDSAVVFPEPDSPKKSLIFMLSSFLGLFFSVFYVLIRSSLRSGVNNPERFEDIGLNVYGTIPASVTQKKYDDENKHSKNNSPRKANDHLLLARDYPADLSVEALRGLRTALHFLMLDAKNKIVMLTSGTQGVGKSFLASNLGAVLAQSGQRVLIIDADMRRGFLHKRFNLDYASGLSDFLAGDTDTLTPISTKIDNLDLIPRGSIQVSPSELLMSKRFSQFMENLDKSYDFILIDTPPVLAVTDSAIIGRYAGTVLIVTRYEVTTVKEVELSVDRFNINGVNTKGIIFNGIEHKATNYYGDSGHYNYSYKSVDP